MILDGEAQFSFDGRTSLLKGPAGAPDRLGHSHTVYNPTDKPVQWMNFNVGTIKGYYDTFNLDDSRIGVPMDAVPTFISWHLDRSLLKPVDHMNGGNGTVQYRSVLDPSVFYTTWSYLDDLFIPPGSSVGPVTDPDMSEVYCVLTGDGSVTVGSETAPIHTGDAIAVRLGETHSLTSSGTAPMEFLIFGIARDMDAKRAMMVRPAPGRRNR